MVNKSCRLMSCAVLAAAASMLPPTAQAQDFFSAFFGGLGGGRPFAPAAPLPFASERGYLPQQARPRRAESAQAGGQAFCVRTCDGRYFPISASDNQSRAASCNNFCPASDTKVVYGGSIDSAVTESGKADVKTWIDSVTKEQHVSYELYVRDAVWPSVALTTQCVGNLMPLPISFQFE